MRATSSCRTTSRSVSFTVPIPSTPLRVSSASARPERAPAGRSTWVGSPVTTMRDPSPSRVKNIFICTGDVFCASSRMTKACDRVRPQHVVERVENRPQIRVDFVSQVARQETKTFAGLDRGAREDNPLHAAGHQQIDGGGNRKIRLAGAGRSQTKDQLVVAHRLDV